MLYMNEFDIANAIERFRPHPILGKAARFLAAFREEVNAHSDGWAYWKPPVRAARRLMELIQHPDGATEARLTAAIGQIKAFYTRHGNAAGMKFPASILAGAKSWKAEVQADSSGTWAANALRFPAQDQAKIYVDDLMMRWTLVRDTRVVESDDEVNCHLEPHGEGSWKLVHDAIP